jgi:hypothetical protein
MTEDGRWTLPEEEEEDQSRVPLCNNIPKQVRYLLSIFHLFGGNQQKCLC